MTALSGEAALFIPGYEYFSAIPHSRQAILTALYRDTALLALIQTALSGDPYFSRRQLNPCADRPLHNN